MSANLLQRREAVGGLGFIVLAALVLAFGDGLVKLISDTVSVWQLVALRALVAVPLLAVTMALGGRCRAWPKRSLWVALRSLLLVGMWILVYLALTGLPLPTVSAALYTAPLMITVFCALAPGRRLAGGEIGAVLLGFVGVLVLLQPGTSAFSPMLWLPLAGAAFYALAALITATHCRGESPLVMAMGVQVAFLVVGVLMLSAVLALPIPSAWQQAAPFVATGWHRLDRADLSQMGVIVAVLAVIAVVASTAMARAYQMAPAPLVAAGDYSYLVFSALWSLLLFDHLPGLWGLFGMTVIVVAGVWATRGGGGDSDEPRRREAGPAHAVGPQRPRLVRRSIG